MFFFLGTNKRPASNMSSGISPPEKKPNIQDVKEYTEAHRLRKEIVAQEFNDDDNNMMDYDDNFNDDDDDDFMQPTIKSKFNKSNDSSGGDNRENKDRSTVVIQQNDASTSVNHAKIISEVLKKYPHLVKNNKNIKLKIMQKGNQQQQQTSPQQQQPPQQPLPKVTISKTKSQQQPKYPAAATATAVGVMASASTAVTTTTTTTASSSSSPTASTTARNFGQKQSLITNVTSNAPKKIDSKTMYALIAKGAENMEGPWLCLKCGVNGRPISIPSYKGFRRHLIGVHNEKIDPLICEHCGWRAQKKTNLMHHMLTVHNIKAPASINFPICKHCNYIAVDNTSLNVHMEENHAYMTDNNKGDFIYFL